MCHLLMILFNILLVLNKKHIILSNTVELVDKFLIFAIQIIINEEYNFKSKGGA